MCSCRGPSACKQCSRLYKRCSCKQWPCTYTAPCVARTCWEESQTHIAAPLWQRRSTHPARALMHAANAPRRSTGNRTPSTTRTPTIRPPGGNDWEEPHSQTAARIARCIHIPPGRSGKERTTSTTTAPHPTRAGPHWKPTADPAGSSNHHAHDQTAYAPAARPVHAAPVLVMGKPPGGHCPTHSKPHPDRPQISQPEPPRPHRRASEARHSVRHTARHFFKSKAQIRHILAASHPL